MTYIKTIKEDACPDVNIFVCDECQKEIYPGSPMESYPEKDVHICEKCIFDRVEEYIKYDIHGMKLFWLKSMEHLYFNYLRKRRNTYLPRKKREEILKKYKYTCIKCGSKENLSIDHIKPVSKGGEDDVHNLTVLCRSCNSKKGAKYEK